MSHEHLHHHSHTESNLRLVFMLNAAFAVIEIIGGLLTNSMAILSDALHDAGDTVAIGVAWYFQRLSAKKRDIHYTFGYRRFSVLGALINSLILLSGSCIILFESIPRIFNPHDVDETGMLALAVLGVLVNGFAMLKTRKGFSRNEQVISLHLLEDVLGWIAVLVVSIVMHFINLPVLDPVLSVVITLFILFRLYGSLKSTFRILLQGTPATELESEITQTLMELKEITGVHDIHIWTMDGTYHVASFHVEVSKSLSLEETELLKKNIRISLSGLRIEHVTIEIELQGQECQLTDC